MKNLNIYNMIFLILLLFLVGCKNSEINKSTGVAGIEKQSMRSPLDSLELFNLLYSDKKILPSYTNFEPFDLSTKLSNDTIKFSSTATIKDIPIIYDLYVKSSLSKEEFKWYNEDQYENIGASFMVDRTLTDISDIKFLNINKQIYPAGLWHWSVEDVGSIKMSEYNNKIYILLNGVDLFCNGAACSSYQLYAIVFDKVTKQIKFNAILTDGIYPYLFSSIHLFESEDSSKLPEFYILKDEKTDIFGIEDFNIFGFKENGEVYKK
jgi:hypothetical protein